MINRIAAPMKAMIIALMIGWPATAMLKWRKPASTIPPKRAPTMPTMMSQKRSRPCPSATWLARNPATSPTNAHTNSESKSMVTGEPLIEMTIPGPLYKTRYATRKTRRGLSIPQLLPTPWGGPEGLRSADFRSELSKSGAQHAVEGRERVDHVGELAQWRTQLQGDHELAEDLARARGDQGRPDEHSTLLVGDQLQRAAVKIVDVTPRGLRGVHRDHGHIDAMPSRRLFRPAHRCNLRVGVGDARHRRVVRARVPAAQPPGDDLAVVIGQMRKTSDAGDVAGAVDPVARLERLR